MHLCRYVVATTSPGFTVVSTSDGSVKHLLLPNGVSNIQTGPQKSSQLLMTR